MRRRYPESDDGMAWLRISFAYPVLAFVKVYLPIVFVLSGFVLAPAGIMTHEGIISNDTMSNITIAVCFLPAIPMIIVWMKNVLDEL